MGNKKTLYEVLNVPPDASFEKIQAEYKDARQRMESGASGLSAPDASEQLKVVNMAYQVLRDTMSRAAYDAKLRQQESLSQPSTLALVPMAVDTQALTMKMEAAVMKADAAALMAQAAMVNASALSLHYASTPQGLGAQASSSFFKTFRFGFTVLGAVVAIGMVTMVLSGRRGSGGETVMDQKMQEKIMLQEYFQMHGVRPSSKAEMDQMEAQRRQEESQRRGEERAQRDTERQADKKSRDEQRLQEETDRLSRTVSENLRRDEEYARRLAQEEDYKQQREQDRIQQEKMQRDAAERDRLREERRKLGLR